MAATITKISNCDVFVYDNVYKASADASSGNLSSHVTVSPADASVSTYINGVAISKLSEKTVPYTGGMYHIHFDSDIPCNVTLSFPGTSNAVVTKLASSEDVERNGWDRPDQLLDGATSFGLLRANPKLTGNIKVVVDSSSNIFLDTFKVSLSLSQREYRKISVNPNDYYGTNLMVKMKDIPTDDLYKIEDGCYDMFAPGNNLSEQYYDTYNYGVRTNRDKLYNENFSFLAPLCIRKKLPDFFLIFKVKGYESVNGDSNSERISYFLKNGTLVKSFDLREGTSLGTYIRNIYDGAKDFVGDIYVASDYNNYNTVNGISLDRGVVAHLYESVCDERAINNQVSLNDWYTLGFERTHSVIKDIVNFEFMFDDTSDDLFSLNTYFGLYVRLNGEDDTFTCIGKTDESYLFDRTPVGSGTTAATYFNPQSFPKLIYGMSTKDSFIRLTNNIRSVDSSVMDNFIRKPDECIASPGIVDISDKYSGNYAFASIVFNDVIDPGEHYRLINRETNRIYEVVISNIKDDTKDISEVEHHTRTIEGEEYDIYRVSIYNTKYRSYALSESDKDVSKSIDLLLEAFEQFNIDTLEVYNNGTDTLSFMYNADYRDVYFEYVSSKGNFYNDSSIDADSVNEHNISIFGYDDFPFIELSDITSVFYPTGFEALGTRYGSIVLFTRLHRISENNDDSYAVVVNNDISEQLAEHETVLYLDSDEDYTLYNKTFPVAYIDSSLEEEEIQLQTITGFGEGSNYIIYVNKLPGVHNNTIYFYNNYPINVGLCSIFPIKDFETTVLDTNNTIFANNDTVSNSGGRYKSTDNVMGKALVGGTEESICDYFDKHRAYKQYSTLSANNESLVRYLTNLYDNDHKQSDVALMVPSSVKWNYVGTDYVGKKMKVMYSFVQDSSVIDNPLTDSLSYFLTNDSSRNVGFITVDKSNDTTTGDDKYVSPLLDVHYNKIYRDYILSGKGSLSDIVFSTKHVNDRFSKVYQHGSNAIEFVSGGVKFKITSNNENIFNISKYNNYLAMFICMSGSNPLYDKPCEILVDETKEQLFIILYTGIGVLDLKYNDNYYNIKQITSVFHNSPISDNVVYQVSSESYTGVPDDAGFFKDTSLYADSSDNVKGYLMMYSQNQDENAYEVDNFIFVSGEIGEFTYNDSYPDRLLIKDTAIRVDSDTVAASNFNYLERCSKLHGNCDMFLYSCVSEDKTSGAESVYTTPTVEELKKYLNNTSIIIKTEFGLRDYTNIDGLFTAEVDDPMEIFREDQNFSVVSHGYVHPCFAEPSTIDVLTFNYDSSIINGIFSKSFFGCNIDVNSVNNIEQMWIKKILNDNGNLQTVPDASIVKDTEIRYTIDLSTNILPVPPTIGNVYTNNEESYSIYSIDNINKHSRYNITLSDCSIDSSKAFGVGDWLTHGYSNLNNIDGNEEYFQVYDASYIYDGSTKIVGGVITVVACKPGQNPLLKKEPLKFAKGNKVEKESLNLSTRAAKLERLVPDRMYRQDSYIAFQTHIANDASSLAEFDVSVGDILHIDNLTLEVTNVYIESYSFSRRTYKDYLLTQSNKIVKNYIKNLNDVINVSLPMKEATITCKVSGFGLPPINGTLVSSDASTYDYDYYRMSSMLISSDQKATYMNIDRIDEVEPICIGGKIEMSPVNKDSSVAPSSDSSTMIFNPQTAGDASIFYNGCVSNEYVGKIYDIHTTSLDIIRNMSPIKNYWESNICRTYSSIDDYTATQGIYSGYEKNMFFASRGVVEKWVDPTRKTRNDITISNWTNIIVSPINKTIELDITASLREYILTSQGFMNNYQTINSENIANKTKYVENSILPYISINNNCPINLYIKKSDTQTIFNRDITLNTIGRKIVKDLAFVSNPNLIDYQKVDNFGHEVIYRNGSYFLRLNKLKAGTYTATFKIEL